MRSTRKVNPYVIGNPARPGCISPQPPSIPNRSAKLADGIAPLGNPPRGAPKKSAVVAKMTANLIHAAEGLPNCNYRKANPLGDLLGALMRNWNAVCTQ